mgnify:CR=1 FL=1
MNFIKRYLPDTLSRRDKIRQRKELIKSRKLYKHHKYYTRKAQSWGNARLASAITGGNASAVDFHIIDKECDHNKSAYRLAQKPRK